MVFYAFFLNFPDELGIPGLQSLIEYYRVVDWCLTACLCCSLAEEEYVGGVMRAQSELIMRIYRLCVWTFVGGCDVVGKDGSAYGIPDVLMWFPAKCVRKFGEIECVGEIKVLEVYGPVLSEEIADGASRCQTLNGGDERRQ